jgi:Putative zinc-finger/Predicted integral membrane protein (DUF2275)
MNCAEVQKYLSDFLDKTLDDERDREIEDHLAACSLCSEEFAGIAECQKLVSGLPQVELPVGFTHQVMARVREAAQPPSLWERLFWPFGIKIPLQATAVVLIALLAAYIYQKQPLQHEPLVALQPENSYRDSNETERFVPSSAQAPTAHSKMKEVAEQTQPRIQKFKDSVQLKGDESSSKLDEQDKGVADVQPNAPETAGPQDQVRSPATLSPAPLQERSSVASEAASLRREQSSSSGELEAKGARAPAPPPERQILSKDAASAAKSSFYPEARERSAAPPIDSLSSGTVMRSADPSDHELAIRLKEPLRDDKPGEAQAERRSSISVEESKILNQARERAVQMRQPQSVIVTTSRSQYELFKKELANLGNIEVESSASVRKNNAVAKSSDQLRIKLTILPPLSSMNPLPSQPASR